jgi:hypothetical protein
MPSLPTSERASPEKPSPAIPTLLTPKEAAKRLKVSTSWLAKLRMRGDGIPYIVIGGRAIRYSESTLLLWLNSRRRLSTSE